MSCSALSAKQQAEKLFTEAKRLVREERYDSAARVLGTALHLTPTAYLYDYRGVVHTLAHRTEHALQSFTQALLHADTHDEQAKIYFHRCMLYGREGSYALALLDIQRAVMLAPENTTYREAKKHIVQANRDTRVEAH